MGMADQIIAYGQAHAAELRRDADRERLLLGLQPRPWWSALIAPFRTLGRLWRSRPRAWPATLRPGIPGLARRGEPSGNPSHVIAQAGKGAEHGGATF